MAKELVAHNKPVFDHLHPRVYQAAIGLVVWYVLSAWLLFDRKDDIGLPLAMVSVLLLVAVLLPLSLALVWKRHRLPHQRHPHQLSFRDWSVGDFAVWGAKIHSRHAAIDMLLPLAAVTTLGPALSNLAASYATLPLQPTTRDVVFVLIGLAVAGGVAVAWVGRQATRESVVQGLAAR